MTDRVGQLLGNYRLLRLIGRGGFADVYLGEHLYLNTNAAIKILQTRLTNEDSTDFINEARMIASLVHPHIVRVLDFGLQDEVPFLVMDFAPNGTLRQRYPKGVPLAPERVAPHVKQVTSALMYAHERRLIHRDIKPENMLLSASDEVLLSDFGIALVTQSSRGAGTMEVVGTAGYMAPEQIQGKPRPASDQYSLGVVVYEWLTGERPFLGTFTEVATQHMFTPPLPLRQKIPTITPDVEEVVMRALAKDPQQRFQTIQAFANAFEQASRSDLPTYVNPTPSPFLFTPPPDLANQNAASDLSPNQYIAQDEVRTIPASMTERMAAEGVQKKRISRRTVVFGLAGAAVVVVAGSGLAFWSLGHRGTSAAPNGISSAGSASSTGVSTHTQQTPLPTTQPTTKPVPTQPAQPTQPPPPTTQPTTPIFTLGALLYTYRGHSGIVYADAWSPSGSQVASCGQDNSVQIWGATTGGNELTYSGNGNRVYALAWAANGQLLASGGEAGVVQVCNPVTANTVYTYTGHTLPVNAIAFSPDGTLIASGSGDKTVQVWNATTGSLVFTYSNHSDVIRGVVWSPDGRSIASASEDKTVQVWNATTGQNPVVYNGHTAGVLNVAWSPDSTRIASVGRDATAQVWNAATGGNIFTYRGHTSRVWGVDWSPGGNRIASCGNDATVQIWDAASGSHIYTYSGHSSNVWSAPWSPNGQLIASASNDGTVQVWRAV
ncbi:MAG TPA: serine/threonine-protein kinase [Ktedonobacteraceae bacterium]|nr:serine/threonine-protein kinase [Ktedonobacteraceae bacterium]